MVTPSRSITRSSFNVTTVTASNKAKLEYRFDYKANVRPWDRTLYIKVVDGFLKEGETITIRMGVTGGGSPGLRLQTFCEDTFEFRVLVDPIATFNFQPLPEQPTIRIVFYFTVLSTLMSAVPLVWLWQSPEPRIWWFLIFIGFLAAVGQFLLTKGYGLAPAAQVGPFTYVNIVFAALFGWLFWEESLDALTWIGALLICIAGIVAAHRTKSHALLGTSARAASIVDTSPNRKTV